MCLGMAWRSRPAGLLWRMLLRGAAIVGVVVGIVAGTASEDALAAEVGEADLLLLILTGGLLVGRSSIVVISC